MTYDPNELYVIGAGFWKPLSLNATEQSKPSYLIVNNLFVGTVSDATEHWKQNWSTYPFRIVSVAVILKGRDVSKLTLAWRAKGMLQSVSNTWQLTSGQSVIEWCENIYV